MFDINAIVNAAIAAAVDARVTEVLQQHANLNAEQAARIVALEERVKALEASPVVIDEAKMVEALNSQEWFWEKLTSKAKEVADAAAEEAIEDHCNSYDHDDYDRLVGKVNELEDDSSLKEAIKDVLDNVSFDVRVSF